MESSSGVNKCPHGENRHDVNGKGPRRSVPSGEDADTIQHKAFLRCLVAPLRLAKMGNVSADRSTSPARGNVAAIPGSCSTKPNRAPWNTADTLGVCNVA